MIATAILLRKGMAGSPRRTRRARQSDPDGAAAKAHYLGVEVTIRPFEGDADADAFRALNEEWIARHFVVEEEDLRQLADPVRAYIEPGGEILIAELAGKPVGCVALAPAGSGAYEVSKMAVSPGLRGRGIGRALLGAAIGRARELGARSLFLGSSTKLESAVHLYEAFGFRHVPPEKLHMPYARADVFMELELESPVSP
jgi:N-acetylglutamate synthase-like GNAT family acetyltransferase